MAIFVAIPRAPFETDGDVTVFDMLPMAVIEPDDLTPAEDNDFVVGADIAIDVDCDGDLIFMGLAPIDGGL